MYTKTDGYDIIMMLRLMGLYTCREAGQYRVVLAGFIQIKAAGILSTEIRLWVINRSE